MKVGDYVRLDKNRGIRKIKELKEHIDYYMFDKPVLDRWGKNSNSHFGIKEQILKSSPNIIDLIEVGDVITFKNDNDVYRVACVPDKKLALDDFYLEKNFDGETEDICVEQDTMQKCIKSIVTKEQFENMEYKVGVDKE